MTEIRNQQLLFKWSQQPNIRARWPELALMFHIPNERHCTAQQGKQLKLAGVRSGVPDLCLPVARGGYHSLYIELKTESGATMPEQDWWIERLNAAGHFAQVCHGWEFAARVLEWYLTLSSGGSDE